MTEVINDENNTIRKIENYVNFNWRERVFQRNFKNSI